jgi:hypothetical protein
MDALAISALALPQRPKRSSRKSCSSGELNLPSAPPTTEKTRLNALSFASTQTAYTRALSEMPKAPKAAVALNLLNSDHGHLLVSWHDSVPVMVARKGRLVQTIEAILEDFNRDELDPSDCYLQVTAEQQGRLKISHSVFRQLPKSPIPTVRLIRKWLSLLLLGVDAAVQTR